MPQTSISARIRGEIEWRRDELRALAAHLQIPLDELVADFMAEDEPEPELADAGHFSPAAAIGVTAVLLSVAQFAGGRVLQGLVLLLAGLAVQLPRALRADLANRRAALADFDETLARIDRAADEARLAAAVDAAIADAATEPDIWTDDPSWDQHVARAIRTGDGETFGGAR